MLARRSWSTRYAEWNKRWGAPFGRPTRALVQKLVPRRFRSHRWCIPLSGYFAFQPNNDTRAVEYPWAFEALQVQPGMTVLDIGGSLAGLQFVLDKVGCTVTNVDPGEEARGVGWPVRPETFDKLNRAFGTHVTLKNCFLEEARLPSESFDRVVSISVLEHIPEADLTTLLAEVRRLLKPGGRFVATLDLFLDVHPFVDKERNAYGHNVSARWLVETSGLELVHGEPSELYGYDRFEPERILKRGEEFFIGLYYPVMAQTLVLRKPD